MSTAASLKKKKNISKRNLSSVKMFKVLRRFFVFLTTVVHVNFILYVHRCIFGLDLFDHVAFIQFKWVISILVQIF